MPQTRKARGLPRAFNPKHARIKKLPKVYDPLQSLRLECLGALLDVRRLIDGGYLPPRRFVFSYKLPRLP